MNTTEPGGAIASSAALTARTRAFGLADLVRKDWRRDEIGSDQAAGRR